MKRSTPGTGEDPIECIEDAVEALLRRYEELLRENEELRVRVGELEARLRKPDPEWEAWRKKAERLERNAELAEAKVKEILAKL